MLPFLLFYFGFSPISFMLFELSCLSDTATVFKLLHDLDLKYSPDTPEKKARIAMTKLVCQQYQKLSYWTYPVIHMSTEQASGVSMMARMPFSKSSCLWWLESSVYELDKPLLLNSFWYFPEGYWRWSIGSGFRAVSASGWGGGIYGYYDYATENRMNRLLAQPNGSPWGSDPNGYGESYIQYLDVRHTVSVGGELLMPKGRLIGNLYRKYMFSSDRERQHACWNFDAKLAVDYKHWTVSMGGYYDQRIFTYGKKFMNIYGYYGGAVELKWAGWWRVYGIKYTYDKLDQHRLSLSVEWQLLKPVSSYYDAKQRLNLHPTERYLKDGGMSIEGGTNLRQHTLDTIKNYIEAWQKENLKRLAKF